MVATVISDPLAMWKIYKRHVVTFNPNFADKPIELKEKNSSPEERKAIIKEMMRAGALFYEVTVYKKSDRLPVGFNPNDGASLYRKTTDALMELVMSSIDYDEICVYFDDHSSLKNNAGTKSARNNAKENMKKIVASEQLHSSDEPLLQLNDMPTGAVGRMREDGNDDSFLVMEKKTISTFIGRRQR